MPPADATTAASPVKSPGPAPAPGAPGLFARCWIRHRTRRLTIAQDREMGRLLDPAAAQELAMTDRYSRLGRYLPPPRRSALHDSMLSAPCSVHSAQGSESAARAGDPGSVPDRPPSASAPLSVLELGCGPGKYVAMLASLGYHVTGVDPFRFPQWDRVSMTSAAGVGRVDLREGVRAEQLPFADGAFDCVVCLGAMLYFDDPARAIDELLRVVRPGGRIVIRTVNRNNRYTRRTGRRLDPASHNLYSMDELLDLLRRHGLTIHDHYSYGYWPSKHSDLWWYLVNVWLPAWCQDWLSRCLPAEERVNLIVCASRPEQARQAGHEGRRDQTVRFQSS